MIDSLLQRRIHKISLWISSLLFDEEGEGEGLRERVGVSGWFCVGDRGCCGATGLRDEVGEGEGWSKSRGEDGREEK